MKLADSDRLMDKCASCGGWPCLEHDGRNIRGCCMDCCETGPFWNTDWGLSVVEWNLEQRKERNKIDKRNIKKDDSVSYVLKKAKEVKKSKRCSKKKNK